MHRPTATGYVYAAYETAQVGLLEDSALAGLTERHKYPLEVPSLRPVSDLAAELIHSDTAGVVFGLHRGHAPRKLLRIVAAVLKQGRTVYFHWPEEQAIERVDRLRFRSYQKLWLVVRSHGVLARGWAVVQRLRRLPPGPTPFELLLAEMTDRLSKLSEQAAPVPFLGLEQAPSSTRPMLGHGVYLRLDFWARINSGGSYGHTCHVARELARVSQGFTCFTASPFALLEEMGLQQVVLPAPGVDGNEENLVAGSKHYHVALKAVLEILRPAYLYERLCLGNFAAAWLSQELRIPYIVEYNGSEISMKRSFDGTGYQHEKYYLDAEMFAFRQAAVISVISEPVKDELVARGHSRRKDPRQPQRRRSRRVCAAYARTAGSPAARVRLG